MKNDTIEFYNKESGRLVTSVRSSMVLPVESLISVDKKTWRVDSFTFAVDYSADPHQAGVRCNVTLVEVAK